MDNKTVAAKEASVDSETFNWGHSRVPWTFNLRLSEPHQRKLEFILAHRREKSMHQMLASLIEAFIDTEVDKLLQAGERPHSARS